MNILPFLKSTTSRAAALAALVLFTTNPAASHAATFVPFGNTNRAAASMTSRDGFVEVKAQFATADDGGLYAVRLQIVNKSTTNSVVARWSTNSESTPYLDIRKGVDRLTRPLTSSVTTIAKAGSGPSEAKPYVERTLPPGGSVDLVAPVKPRLTTEVKEGADLQSVRVSAQLSVIYKVLDNPAFLAAAKNGSVSTTVAKLGGSGEFAEFSPILQSGSDLKLTAKSLSQDPEALLKSLPNRY